MGLSFSHLKTQDNILQNTQQDKEEGFIEYGRKDLLNEFKMEKEKEKKREI